MLKFVLYAVLAYLLVRAVANLLGAMLRQRVGGDAPPYDGNRRRGASGGQREANETRATRLRDEEDVEDARWEDL